MTQTVLRYTITIAVMAFATGFMLGLLCANAI